MAYSTPDQLFAADLARAATLHKASSSPEPSKGAASDTRGGRPHRRGYQACQRCRERKVKCDLGSVDAPTDPPCKRCLRERLHCEFASTRKKQKKSDGTARPVSSSSAPDVAEADDDNDLQQDPSHYDLIQAQGRSSSGTPADTASSRQSWRHGLPKVSVTSQPRDGGSHPTLSVYPSPSPAPASGARKDLSEYQLRSHVAATHLGAPMSSTQDNIMLLVDAANAFSESGTPHDKESPLSDRTGRKRGFSSLDRNGLDVPVNAGSTPQEQAELEAGLKVWSEMRFVRHGWFNSYEAMAYIDYFYGKLAPMTPVVLPDFRSPLKHRELLADEPILAQAILAIVSRNMPLSGHAAWSRAYDIHNRLWNNLRHQVERLLWGQEQFGGGGGSNAQIRELSTGQITWKGSLRTLGTIEALLLLTDWQPRALHFPPNDDEHSLLDRGLPASADANAKGDGADDEPRRTRDYESLPYVNWLEPAWRSDRMSWMLLGLAQSLAFELGVFDTSHLDCRHQHGPDSECARKRRIRRLILVYVAQTSGRMSVQSSLNVEDWEADTTWDVTSRAQRRGSAEPAIDAMQACWVHIARIMNRANREIFAAHQFTRELVHSGRYKDSIATFVPLLQEWEQSFEECRSRIHPVMQSILLMEYEYARLYINSLGLQNVVGSWVEGGSKIGKAQLVKIAEDNRPYIDAVTEAALNILSLVVDGIGAKGYLRDAPVRTYLRCLSAMMFTLKRFSLGTHEALVRKCLQQLDKTTAAMSKEVVDDIHLASSTSRLVQNIVKNVKQTLIRVQQPGTGSAGPSRDHSRPQSPNGHGHDHGHAHVNPNAHAHAHGHAQGHVHAQQPATDPTGLAHFSPDYYLNDPLAGIQARPMAELASQTFVPPPNFLLDGHDLDSALPDDMNFDDPNLVNLAANDMAGDSWLALPIDNLLKLDAATLDQGFGGIGPTVGHRDMLEVLTDQDYSQFPWNGNQTFGFGSL